MSDSTFTSRHEADLVAYFSGALTGEMGLRSNLGGLLEQAAASATSEHASVPDWNGWSRYDDAGLAPLPDQTMVVKPDRNGASMDSTDAAASALAAVRQERRVRAALRIVGATHARVLAAAFTPRPVTSPAGLESLGDLRAVVALIGGAERARMLVLRIAARPASDTPKEHREAIKAERADAKAELASYQRQAKLALAGAREAYSQAWPIVQRAEREERARRFAGGGR